MLTQPATPEMLAGCRETWKTWRELLAPNRKKGVFGQARITAGCYKGNLRSMRMIAACGFVRRPEGDTREKHCATGAPITQYDFVRERC